MREITGSGGSDALDPPWTVRVELNDRASRTYVGWLSTRSGWAMYERSKGGSWHRPGGRSPAEPELGEAFESLMLQAIARRSPTLQGTWANGRLEITDDSE